MSYSSGKSSRSSNSYGSLMYLAIISGVSICSPSDSSIILIFSINSASVANGLFSRRYLIAVS